MHVVGKKKRKSANNSPSRRGGSQQADGVVSELDTNTKVQRCKQLHRFWEGQTFPSYSTVANKSLRIFPGPEWAEKCGGLKLVPTTKPIGEALHMYHNHPYR